MPKHPGTDKEPNLFGPEGEDEVWMRDEQGRLVKVEVEADDAEAGQ